jgi:hypothetical protein
MRIISVFFLLVVLIIATLAINININNFASSAKLHTNGVQTRPKVNPAQLARLYVSFCPTYFTNAIAVVDVSVTTGAWTVLGTSHLPSGVFGCSADYSPTFASDPENPDKIWLDFTSDTGYFVSIETTKNPSTNETTVETAAFESRSEFFTGFLNFKVRDSKNVFEGMTGTVTESGFCSDGCIGYGIQNLSGSKRERSRPLPFRAISDDTSFLDKQNSVFYVQASHDLRDTPCAPQDFQDCLLSIDSNTGELLKSVYNHDEHVYRFGNPSHATTTIPLPLLIQSNTTPIVDAFVVGMNSRCNRSSQETSYAFARVNLAQSQFELISCITTKIVIQEAPWISAFSPANDVFVTSSGDGDGDDPQFVTFDVSTGKSIVDTKLSGLAKKLDAKMGLIFVWSVSMPLV